MTDRKKPGVAFWATVVLVVALLGYLLSFGPACLLVNQKRVEITTVARIYRPLVRMACGETIFAAPLRRYGDLGNPNNVATVDWMNLALMITDTITPES
jgi:hypothetical protein